MRGGSRNQRGQQQQEEELLMKHVKTLTIYYVGNWEPMMDYGAEEWK